MLLQTRTTVARVTSSTQQDAKCCERRNSKCPNNPVRMRETTPTMGIGLMIDGEEY